MTTEPAPPLPQQPDAPVLPQQPEPPVLPETPAKKRGMGLILALIGVGVSLSLVAGLGAFLVVDPFNMYGRHDTLAIQPPDPLRAHRANLQNTLDARATALLAGDENGWLAAVDPDNDTLVADQGRLYQNLTEMGVGRYAYEIRGTTGLPGGSITLTASVRIRYCFGAAECQPTESEAHLMLRQTDGGGLLVTKYAAEGDIRPWEVTDLRVKVGERVVIVAGPKDAHRLSTFRYQADRAAARAERFAPDGAWAGKHVLAIGRPKGSGGDWYDGSLGDMDYGFLYDLTAPGSSKIGAVEHVMRGDKIDRYATPILLGWHMGYGAAALGIGEDDVANWWFVNGVANRMATSAGDPRRFVERGEMRALLKKWKGDLSKFYPDYDASAEEQGWWDSAALAVVHQLIDKHGEKKFISFFNAVARDGEDYDDAAQEHLGKSLDKVEADIRKYLRSF